MSSSPCTSGRGCRCAIIGVDPVTSTGGGTGGDPRILGLTCATLIAECLAGMLDGVGFVYNPSTGFFEPTPGTLAGAVLTSVGDGTAFWVS